MSQTTRKIFMVILVVRYACEASKLQNKFVYEKDISEHCLRRVMPSVFLGWQAMDAYSQVLYFSKVDLPYSCFISVRAESGSNIILVVQLSIDEDLKAVCAKDPNQLLVYELGETFGGYWGPQDLIRKDHNVSSIPKKEDYYTLKYTSKIKTVSTPKTKASEGVSLLNTEDTNDLSGQLTESQDFMTIEIPLVNVSAQLVPGEERNENLHVFEDETFDMVYNVQPSPREVYVTTEMPLVQFSMEDNSGWGYQEARNPFGQSWNKYNSANKLKQKTGMKKIPVKLKFRSPGSWLHTHDNDTTLSSDLSTEDNLAHTDIVRRKQPLRVEDKEVISLEELMSAYNRSGSLTTISEEELQREVSQLLDKLIALGHNQSEYIYDTNTEEDTEYLTEFITTTTISPLKTTSILDHRITTARVTIEDFGEQMLSTLSHSKTSPISKETITTEPGKELFSDTFAEQTKIHSTKTTDHFLKHDQNITSTLKSHTARLQKKKNNTVTTKSQTLVEHITPKISQYRKSSSHAYVTSTTMGSLRGVDHESWENLVRAAPVMAVRLDETIPHKIKDELENNNKSGTTIHDETYKQEDILTKNTNSKPRAKKKRKKRYIEGIMIEEAKPHNWTTKEDESTTTASSVDVSDIQQFAQLVELVDDDIHDRAALRYLSQYVGRPMFNLCQASPPKPRYVHLFNSSRLVISIGNFTMRRMQLVITPARRVLVGKSRCEQSHLECQVNGNRVCIDGMSACDGVANCGETDIYDEDRLMCGGYMGLHHNVCLAAITFLAVLLTIIYMVHYWLGRCLPKVSEAFFIYTEGDENVLFLDSIMRSPNDTVFVQCKSFENFETDALFTTTTKKESKIYSCLKKCMPCFFKKEHNNNNKMDSKEWGGIQLSPLNTELSFPELEINKMINEQFKDATVQTGESLEMRYFNAIDKTTEEAEYISPEQSPVKLSSPRLSTIEIKRAKDELSRLKFFNKTRKDSLKTKHSSIFLDRKQESFTNPSKDYGPTRNSEETDTSSLSYDELQRRDLDKTSVKKAKAKVSTEANVLTQKQQTKQLRFNEDVVNIPRHDNDSEEEISALQYDESSRNLNNAFEDSEPTVPSTNRDFKRFWVGSKGKKKKKK